MKLAAKIGVIQLTDHRLRLIVVKTGSADPKVLERIDEALPPMSDDPDEALHEQAAFIRSRIKTLKHTPSIYMLNTPHAWSVMRLLSVPFKGAKKVRAAITYELEPYLAIPIDDLIIDHNSVSELDGKTEVFIMGLQRDPVTEQLDLLHRAGITVEGIGLDIVGLSALSLDTLLTDSTPQALVVDHEGHSYLTVVHNRSLAYVQRIMGTPDHADAWSQEIQNAVRAFHANSLATVELTGVVCTDNGIQEDARVSLEEKLALPVHIAALGESWAPASILESSDASTWLSMIGTGSAAAGGAFNISFAQSGSDKDTANPYKLHIAAIAVLVLFTLTAHLFITHLKTQNNSAEIEQIGQRVWEEFSATYPNDPAAQARPAGDVGGFMSFEAMSQALEMEQNTSANLTPEMFNQPSLMEILRELSAHMPDSQVTVLDISITSRRAKMEINVRGDMKNTNAWSKMVEGLEQSTILDLGKNERTLIDGKETFKIVAYIKSDSSDS